ncbi:hypothetical protein [Humisphaera borealis]|uniref:Uncharacterized protein n=1 Tax=Humisphaera borealis TaxID=2807512 RepID=A0A7M2WZV1_9BACT|nr:hypothetical protein [Humisphaera borealis]QOV90904.1 hypothetical protein IPV69_05960 [Humisphaera borealis]
MASPDKITIGVEIVRPSAWRLMLASRKFWGAVGTIVAAVLTRLIGGEAANQIAAAIAMIGGVYIASVAVEDGMRAGSPTQVIEVPETDSMPSPAGEYRTAIGRAGRGEAGDGMQDDDVAIGGPTLWPEATLSPAEASSAAADAAADAYSPNEAFERGARVARYGGGITHKIPQLVLLLILPALALVGGCSSIAALDQPTPTWLQADRATYDAITPDYRDYIAADTTLDELRRERRLRTVETWRIRLEDAERRAVRTATPDTASGGSAVR